MLRHRGQPLIEQKLEGEVVGADGEVVPPQIWAPVTHGTAMETEAPEIDMNADTRLLGIALLRLYW